MEEEITEEIPVIQERWVLLHDLSHPSVQRCNYCGDVISAWPQSILEMTKARHELYCKWEGKRFDAEKA